MSELKPNDPLVKEMLNDHLLVLVTKEAWILLNERRRYSPDLKAELVEAIRETKGIVLDDNGRSELDDIAGLPTEFIRVEDAIRAINTIMGDTE